MQILELREKLGRDTERVRLSKIRALSVTEDGLVVDDAEPVWLDDLAQDKIAKFLEIPTNYANKVPAELRRYNINYLIGQTPEDAEVNLHWFGDNLTGIYPADKRVVPVNVMAARLAQILSPEDEVVQFRSDDNRFHMDVMSRSHSVNVPARNKSWRPDSDDITHGGIRLIGTTNPNSLPSLETYMHRLVCSNGLAVKEPDLQVSLRGNTVEEVLESLEMNARMLLSGLPDRLEQYRLSDEVEVEGNVEQIINQLGHEAGLSERVINRVISQAAEIPPVGLSAYDLTQLYTSVANMDGVSYSSRIKLQNLGGQLVTNHEAVDHRCQSCARVL